MEQIIRSKVPQKMLFGPLKRSDETIHYTKTDNILFSTQTPFQKIEIFDTPLYGKALYLDEEIQSTEADEHIYHESVVHPALLSHPDPRFILVLGAGEGATGREVLKHRSVQEVVSVEIDPEVPAIAEKYLPEWQEGVFQNPRYTLHIADAQRYVAETAKTFDVIISDLPFRVREKNRKGPELVYDASFFLNVKRCLRQRGIFVMHAGSMAFPKKLRLFQEAHRCTQGVFRFVVPYAVYLDSFHAMIGMLLCSDITLPSSATLMKRFAERGLALAFYDEETHTHLFSLPGYVRDALQAPDQKGA